MHNPIYQDVAVYLQDNQFGVIGETIFGGEYGNDAGKDIDSQICVLDGVQTPFDIKDLAENLSVQILVRGEKRESQLNTHSKARSIYKFFVSNTQNLQANGVCYTDFEPESFGYIGRDDQERPVYSMNFQTYRNAIGA